MRESLAWAVSFCLRDSKETIWITFANLRRWEGLDTFHFPNRVKIKLNTSQVEFKIVEITENVFALRNHMHAMQTKDEVTFGYIVFRDEHLYAYTLVEDPNKKDMSDENHKYGYRLIYLSYVGPADQMKNEEMEFVNPLLKAIAYTVVQYSRYKNQHPAILDKDRFNDIYKEIVKGLEEGTIGAVSPFINPIYDLAVELRDFYGSMCKNLETIKDQLHETEALERD